MSKLNFKPTPCRARNATFSGLPTSSNTTTDLSVLDACDDSAQSAPAGFTFDSINIPDYKTEQTTQDTNADLVSDFCPGFVGSKNTQYA